MSGKWHEIKPCLNKHGFFSFHLLGNHLYYTNMILEMKSLFTEGHRGKDARGTVYIMQKTSLSSRDIHGAILVCIQWMPLPNLYVCTTNLICLHNKLSNNTEQTFGLISIVKNSLNWEWGFNVWSFFSSVTNHCGAKWTFLRRTHLKWKIVWIFEWRDGYITGVQ